MLIHCDRARGTLGWAEDQARGRVEREDPELALSLPLGKRDGGTWKDHIQHLGVISSVKTNARL